MFEKKKKQDLALTQTVLVKPYEVSKEENFEKYQKFSLSSIGALGVGFDALSQALNAISTAQGKSGIYHIDVSKGASLAQRHGENYFIGTAVKKGRGIFNQSKIKKIPFNPTMLCMAMVLVSIEKKMNTIEETQQKILAFLEKKERTKLEGNLAILTDILKQYKYNWNNQTYKNNTYQQIQEIKREAEQDVQFYRSQIEDGLKQRKFIHTDKNVEERIKELGSSYNNYQLSLYIYAFAYFLEVIFLENFESEYLESVLESVKNHCGEYTELYNRAYALIEGYSNTSVESHAVKALSGISKGAGNLFAKIPVVNKTKIDENLIFASESLSQKQQQHVLHTMDGFCSGETQCVTPFLENIQMLKSFRNEDMQVLIEGQNLYLKQS